MRVTVIGTGYTGLATEACLAGVRSEVFYLDLEEREVAPFKGGHVAIRKRGLDQIVVRALALGSRPILADLKWSHGRATGNAAGSTVFRQ